MQKTYCTDVACCESVVAVHILTHRLSSMSHIQLAQSLPTSITVSQACFARSPSLPAGITPRRASTLHTTVSTHMPYMYIILHGCLACLVPLQACRKHERIFCCTHLPLLHNASSRHHAHYSCIHVLLLDVPYPAGLLKAYSAAANGSSTHPQQRQPTAPTQRTHTGP